MKYFYEENPITGLKAVIEADLKNHWSPYEIHPVDYAYSRDDIKNLRNIVV